MIIERALTPRVMLTEDGLRERDLLPYIKDFVSAILNTNQFWHAGPLNPWKLKGSGSIPETYLHPFQPDIDFIYGPERGEVRSRPVCAVEIKLFHEKNAYGIPKTLGAPGVYGDGFYAGIGQALALLSYGVDYASLWHVFLVPHQKWANQSKTEKELDQRFAKHLEWYGAYVGLLNGMLRELQIPIGYAAFALILPSNSDENAILLHDTEMRVDPPRNPILNRATPSEMRELICKALDVATHDSL